ncbi:MAG: hypothetical protein GY754_26705 [bacterium]|nr:hypothetical protein [bacterium]
MNSRNVMSRKEFLRLSASGAASILLSSVGLSSLFGSQQKENMEYLRNKNLETIKKGYKGNPFADGKFLNEEKGYSFSFSSIAKWKLSRNPQAKEKKNDRFKLTVIKNKSFLDSKEDMIVWLGHASFFIRIEGKTILTDPNLTSPPFVSRRSELPCEIEDIKGLDYLLISHNHLDHLDSDTLEDLDLKKTLALVPLRMGKLVKSFNEDVRVQEAGWYQKYNTGDDNIEIYFMPARHFSNRSLWDQNETLWGTFVIKTKKKTIFFGGDAAWSPTHFKETGSFFTDIDICLMPVGAYSPRYICKDCHVNPEESVRAFNDLKGKSFIPMHYGTFDTTDEPYGEPLRWTKKLEKENKINGELRVLDVGEAFSLSGKKRVVS